MGFTCGVYEVEMDTANSEKLTLANMRPALGCSRNQLAFVMRALDLAIVNWEESDPISPVYVAKT